MSDAIKMNEHKSTIATEMSFNTKPHRKQRKLIQKLLRRISTENSFIYLLKSNFPALM